MPVGPELSGLRTPNVSGVEKSFAGLPYWSTLNKLKPSSRSSRLVRPARRITLFSDRSNCQALGPRLRDSQIYGFESWAKEYRGDLGIALSDVYGIEAFLRDFDMYFCKLFDGARHDSGDPFTWGERMIDHYTRSRVDPRTKTLIFSDGLTIPRTIELYQQFKGRCQLAFGIGTNLTNDLGYEPLQIVIKMIRCNGQPVAKLSDTPTKNMCDDEKYLAYLRQVFEIEPPDF